MVERMISPFKDINYFSKYKWKRKLYSYKRNKMILNKRFYIISGASCD
jgi:hypothetical protein